MGEDRTPPERRLTVSDAAQELGISAEAVRSRIKRGTVGSVKEGSTVYVLLPDHPDAARTRPNDDQTTGRTTPEHDRADAQELVDSLLDQVAYMREQLAEEREARRRADTIIAQLTQANAALAQRVSEIEPPEVPGAPESADEGHGGDTTAEPPFTRERPSQREAEHRSSWWRRFFGFE